MKQTPAERLAWQLAMKSQLRVAKPDGNVVASVRLHDGAKGESFRGEGATTTDAVHVLSRELLHWACEELKA